MTKLKAVKMQVVSKLPSENFAGYLNFLLFILLLRVSDFRKASSNKQ